VLYDIQIDNSQDNQEKIMTTAKDIERIGQYIKEKKLGAWCVSPAERRNVDRSQTRLFLAVKWASLAMFIDSDPDFGDSATLEAELDSRLQMDTVYAEYIVNRETRHRFWSIEGWEKHLENRENNIPLLPQLNQFSRNNIRCSMYPLEWFGLAEKDVEHFSRLNCAKQEKVYVVKHPRVFTKKMELLGINISTQRHAIIARDYPSMAVISAIREIVSRTLANVPKEAFTSDLLKDENYKLTKYQSSNRLNISISPEDDALIVAICNKNECTANTLVRAILEGDVFTEYAKNLDKVA
jgi:hypothetical protein